METRGLTGSSAPLAPGFPLPLTPTVERWLREGRRIGRTPPHTFNSGARALGAAQAEGARLGLKGDVRRLFELEAWEGRITPSQYENVTEQGFLDELITPLTAGIAHGPGAGSTKVTTGTPRKGGGAGAVSVENEPGVGEQTQEAASSLLGGLPWLQIAELVGGAALVMFGLVQLGQKAGITVPGPRP